MSESDAADENAPPSDDGDCNTYQTTEYKYKKGGSPWQYTLPNEKSGFTGGMYHHMEAGYNYVKGGTPAEVEDGTLIEWDEASLTINGTQL